MDNFQSYNGYFTIKHQSKIIQDYGQKVSSFVPLGFNAILKNYFYLFGDRTIYGIFDLRNIKLLTHHHSISIQNQYFIELESFLFVWGYYRE